MTKSGYLQKNKSFNPNKYQLRDNYIYKKNPPYMEMKYKKQIKLYKLN